MILNYSTEFGLFNCKKKRLNSTRIVDLETHKEAPSLKEKWFVCDNSVLVVKQVLQISFYYQRMYLSPDKASQITVDEYSCCCYSLTLNFYNHYHPIAAVRHLICRIHQILTFVYLPHKNLRARYFFFFTISFPEVFSTLTAKGLFIYKNWNNLVSN